MQSQPQQKQLNKGFRYLIDKNLTSISSLFNQAKQQVKKQTAAATDSNESNTNLHKTTTNKTTSNNNMVRLNWPQTRRQLSLLLVSSFIMIIVSVLSSSSNAEHALSEVWSESDGLQMKYSTDHEDLLSTKGSELQLNVHGKPNESGGSGEESAATSGGTTSNQEGSSSSSENESESNGTPTTNVGGSDHASDGSSGQSNTIPTSTSNNDDTESSPVSSNDDSSDRGGSSSSGEDSADSTSSQNRVPLSKQHSSGNSFIRQHQSSRFSEPSARFRTNSVQRDDSLSNKDEETRATRYKSESDAFNSIPSSNPFGNGNNNNDDAGSMSDQVNVENGAGDDLPSAQASQEMVAGKAFRQVGRMFKEAVKMGNSDKPKSLHKSSKSGNKDNSNENEESNDEENNNSNEQVNGSEKQQQDDDAPSSASQEPDYNQFKSSANSLKMAGSPKGRQNMIDFDRMVDNKAMMMNQQQQTALQQQQGDSPDEISNVDGGEEESGPISNDDYRRSLAAQNRVPQIGRQQLQQLMNSPPDEFGMFQPNNFQNSNPFFASGSSPEKKERVAPSSKQANNKQHTTNSKPLAYFKGLSLQQKQASEEARRAPQMSANRQQANQQQQQPESPDNVRDNFISPGHFPGSMPHLTQAASETQKKEAEVPASNQQPVIVAAAATTSSTSSSAPTTAPSSSSDQSQAIPLASSDLTISVASSTSVVSSTSPSNVAAESSQQGQQQSDTKQSKIGTGSRAEPSPSVESRERDLQIHVTPVPEIQPESQQIMAPVYFSTTTMAPLPSTSAIPTSGGDNKATTTSSEPPTLKRFKFRKYRR